MGSGQKYQVNGYFNYVIIAQPDIHHQTQTNKGR